MKRYKIETLRVSGPIYGFLIHTPSGKKMRDIYPNTIVKELNRMAKRIKQLEEDLMDAKNKHAALVADVALYEDRAERIKRLEDIINRAACWFFQDGSDSKIASEMLAILEEVRKP